MGNDKGGGSGDVSSQTRQRRTDGKSEVKPDERVKGVATDMLGLEVQAPTLDSFLYRNPFFLYLP
jgi:hypothetical protein